MLKWTWERQTEHAMQTCQYGRTGLFYLHTNQLFIQTWYFQKIGYKVRIFLSFDWIMVPLRNFCKQLCLYLLKTPPATARKLNTSSVLCFKSGRGTGDQGEVTHWAIGTCLRFCIELSNRVRIWNVNFLDSWNNVKFKGKAVCIRMKGVGRMIRSLRHWEARTSSIQYLGWLNLENDSFVIQVNNVRS